MRDLSPRRARPITFADVADALRKLAEDHGQRVYVSTNHESIDLVSTTRGNTASETDIKVKIRRVPRG